jgi:hypothetical protein
MPQTVSADEVAAKVAMLVGRQIGDLQAQIDSVDRGVIEAGVTASRALAQAENLSEGIRSAFRAAGMDGVSFTDPVAARVQARKRRIERTGFRLLQGGRSS